MGIVLSLAGFFVFVAGIIATIVGNTLNLNAESAWLAESGLEKADSDTILAGLGGKLPGDFAITLGAIGAVAGLVLLVVGILWLNRKPDGLWQPELRMSRTMILVEGAMMLALAFALSSIPAYRLPYGGSVTFFSTLPILVFSLRHNLRWGMLVAFVFSLMQFIQGINNLSWLSGVVPMVLCVLFDYILAYSALGLAGSIARRFQNTMAGLLAAVMVTGLLRYLCSFISGVVVWQKYLHSILASVLYSIGYNAGWWLPDIIILLVALMALRPVKQLKLFARPGSTGQSTQAA